MFAVPREYVKKAKTKKLKNEPNLPVKTNGDQVEDWCGAADNVDGNVQIADKVTQFPVHIDL